MMRGGILTMLELTDGKETKKLRKNGKGTTSLISTLMAVMVAPKGTFSIEDEQIVREEDIERYLLPEGEIEYPPLNPCTNSLKIIKNNGGTKHYKKDVEKSKNRKAEEEDKELGEQLIQEYININNKLMGLKEEYRKKCERLESTEKELKYKEKELYRREEDLRYHKEKIEIEWQKIIEEKKKIETQKKIGNRKKSKNENIGNMEEKLKRMEEKIKNKEKTLERREKYLIEKEEELNKNKMRLIKNEVKKMETKLMIDEEIEKVQTGIIRLDDLLLGGLPQNSNVLITGPPFIGKNVLLNLFILQGLRSNTPTIYVTTNKSASEIKKELKLIIPNFEEYEKKGLMFFIDAYSKRLGLKGNGFNVEYTELHKDINELELAFNRLPESFSKNHKQLRIVVNSISSLIAQSSSSKTFNLIQLLCEKSRQFGASSLFNIDPRMHQESEIGMFKHLMDGVIEFEENNMKNMLRVRGNFNAQTRAWVEYKHSRDMLDLVGSFSLEHIK